ncbi:MAG: sialidase family protein [Planctomycetota bacterium]
MTKTLLLGTRRGLFIATNESGRWAVSAPHLLGQPIYCASADARDGTTLFSGRNEAHWGPGIWYSRDFGATWLDSEKQPRFAESAGLAVEAIWQIVPGGLDQPGVMYAGVTPAALFKSEDHGKTWSEVEGLTKHPSRKDWQPGNGGLCLHSIIVDPEHSQHLLVGISSVGVFETFDGGVNWSLENRGLPNVFDPSGSSAGSNTVGTCVHKIAFAPSAPGVTQRVYQQNHMGLFRRDGVGAWESIQNNQPYTFGFPLAAHPRDRERAYVIPLKGDGFRAPDNGALAVYETRDAGASWSPLRKGLPTTNYNGILRDAFAIDQVTPCGLYFGTNGGQVFGSEDEGVNWELIADALPPVNSVRVV